MRMTQIVFLSFQAESPRRSPATAGRRLGGVSATSALLQRGSFSLAPFEFEHHAFDVAIILMPLQELQTFLGITPVQDFDGLLTRAPGIHLTLVGHVQINGVASGKRPTVIFHAIILSRRK